MKTINYLAKYKKNNTSQDGEDVIKWEKYVV